MWYLVKMKWLIKYNCSNISDLFGDYSLSLYSCLCLPVFYSLFIVVLVLGCLACLYLQAPFELFDVYYLR